jgi:hypothetical protein
MTSGQALIIAAARVGWRSVSGSAAVNSVSRIAVIFSSLPGSAPATSERRDSWPAVKARDRLASSVT